MLEAYESIWATQAELFHQTIVPISIHLFDEHDSCTILHKFLLDFREL